MAQLSLMKLLSAYPTCRLCRLWEEREVTESDNLVVVSAKTWLWEQSGTAWAKLSPWG